MLYSSVATGENDAGELRGLLERARAYNASNGITGVLIFYPAHRIFVQVLEGPRADVLALLERVRADPRHRGLRVHFEAAVRERNLGAWPMGFLTAEGGTADAISDEDHGDAWPRGREAVGMRLLRFVAGGAPPGGRVH